MDSSKDQLSAGDESIDEKAFSQDAADVFLCGELRDANEVILSSDEDRTFSDEALG